MTGMQLARDLGRRFQSLESLSRRWGVLVFQAREISAEDEDTIRALIEQTEFEQGAMLAVREKRRRFLLRALPASIPELAKMRPDWWGGDARRHILRQDLRGVGAVRRVFKTARGGEVLIWHATIPVVNKTLTTELCSGAIP